MIPPDLFKYQNRYPYGNICSYSAPMWIHHRLATKCGTSESTTAPIHHHCSSLYRPGVMWGLLQLLHQWPFLGSVTGWGKTFSLSNQNPMKSPCAGLGTWAWPSSQTLGLSNASLLLCTSLYARKVTIILLIYFLLRWSINKYKVNIFNNWKQFNKAVTYFQFIFHFYSFPYVCLLK